MLRQTLHTFYYKYCEAGHTIYSGSGPLDSGYCQICGAGLVTQCASCATPLPARFESPVYLTSGEPVHPPRKPGACGKCGTPYPWSRSEPVVPGLSDREAIDVVIASCRRFHMAVRQLRKRHGDRAAFDVDDEYDVQDLLRALLSLHFDDIRPEEWTPSYAGGSARIDFLIRPHMILVEVKKTRRGLTDRQLGNELLEDIARYGQLERARTLVCFIYDPEERISNRHGLVADLESTASPLNLRVVISPME